MNGRVALAILALGLALTTSVACGGGSPAAPKESSRPAAYQAPTSTALAGSQPAATQAPATVVAPAESPNATPPAATETAATASTTVVASTPTQAPVAQPTTPPPPAETAVATPTTVPAPQPVQFTMVMKDETFSTSSLSVKASQPVTLLARNDGKEIHNWALCRSSDCGAFIAEGDLLAAGTQGQVQFTLAQPGTYKFECEVHTKTMVGTLVVS